MKYLMSIITAVFIAALLSARAPTAQLPSQIELACPAGRVPLSILQTYDPATGSYRQYGCIDSTGHLFLQDTAGSSFPLLAPAGSFSAPSYSFAANTGKGMLDAGVDWGANQTLGFSTGGSAIAELASGNGLRIIGTGGYFISSGTDGNAAIGFNFNSNGAITATGTVRFQVKDQGSCTMAAGTCSAQSFGSTYSTAPNCLVTWNGSGTLTGVIKAPSTTGNVTPSSSVGTDTAVVNWACFGN